jgi:hypothetical protein
MAEQTKYSGYQEVPWYRRQWFFWLMYILVTPVGLGLLISGEVYYRKNDQVHAFGMANRIVAGILGVIWFFSLLSGLTTG